MRPGVLIKDGFLSEVFTTLGTFVRLFASVNANVLIKNRSLPEEPWTVWTSERFLVRMDS